MQTFLPYPDIIKSLQCLDDRRLGNQRNESKQILQALYQGPKTLYDKPFKKYCWSRPLDLAEYSDLLEVRNTPWYNHPAVQMWKGYTNVLEIYYNECILEWLRRGKNNRMLFCGSVETASWNYFTENFPYLFDIGSEQVLPGWWGKPKFHDSHKSNLLRKKPEHYGQFGWDVPNNLPYVWPI